MKKNKKVVIERYLYLEEWLKNNYPNDLTDIELIKYFSDNFNNKHDIRYLLSAYFLPMNNFKDASDINDLCYKYSITKSKALERINEISMIDGTVKKKLVKPRMVITYDNVSDIINNYLDKNKNLLDRKIILEIWLKENFMVSSEEMINYIYILFNEDDAKYLTNAYFMPVDEIISQLIRYDINNSAIYEGVIQKLMKDYDVDRKTILLRIEDVIAINYLINIKNNCVKNMYKVKKSIKMERKKEK